MMVESNNLDAVFGFISNEDVRNQLRRSEDRIRRAFDELFGGYALRAEDVLNEIVRVEDYTGLVTVEGITFYSFCGHHFSPFFGTASVTYQPGEIITGLGKIVRLVHDVHARRLQIQETMTKDIAEDIMRVLGAKGVLVSTKARHLCMCSRGPKDDGAVTVVSYGIGTLEKQALLAVPSSAASQEGRTG
jgi:GTP cyclohydrolase I